MANLSFCGGEEVLALKCLARTFCLGAVLAFGVLGGGGAVQEIQLRLLPFGLSVTNPLFCFCLAGALL